MAHQQVITTEKHVTQRQLTTAAAMEIGDSLHIDKTLEETLSGPDIGKVLSKRERQILEYIVEGNTNKEIAQKLYRTQRTVRIPPQPSDA